MLAVMVLWPVVASIVLLVLSMFTGWDVTFGLRRVPLPIVDVIRLHEGYDAAAPVGGVYVGYHYFFLQVIWGEL